MSTQAWSIVSGAWAAIGPLVGVLFGAYLSRSWDQRRWVLNNRTEEYRDLLESLTRIASRYLEIRTRSDLNVIGVEEQHELVGASGDGGRVILSRIFVAERIHDAEIHVKWRSLFQEPFDRVQFAEKLSKLHETILVAARGDLGV